MTTHRERPLQSIVDIDDQISAQRPQARKMSAVYIYSSTEVTQQSKYKDLWYKDFDFHCFLFSNYGFFFSVFSSRIFLRVSASTIPGRKLWRDTVRMDKVHISRQVSCARRLIDFHNSLRLESSKFPRGPIQNSKRFEQALLPSPFFFPSKRPPHRKTRTWVGSVGSRLSQSWAGSLMI